jgi:hypothetical protein
MNFFVFVFAISIGILSLFFVLFLINTSLKFNAILKVEEQRQYLEKMYHKR